ncbi:HVA22-like protein c isoform X1 [Syzygium oleosum]|uniref:HVA22-like protein c isoform X1 n=1 Tax=Syzygium oleosum TaxID=219896 RepID=UPI0011D1BBDF|nr:HVA22-like protein c isoform X1 [Syzygium oleosum]
MGSGNLLQVVASNFDVLALPLVTLVFPLYASIKAIETRSRTDDQQWLTYWVLYSLITLFELTFAKLLEWFPIWPYAKLIFACWLVLPHFNGAAHVYRHFIRPFYMNPHSTTMWYVPRKGLFHKRDDVLTAAEKYMEEHGTEAFERLISKRQTTRSRWRTEELGVHGPPEEHHWGFDTNADREARARRKTNYVIFDDDYRY